MVSVNSVKRRQKMLIEAKQAAAESTADTAVSNEERAERTEAIREGVAKQAVQAAKPLATKEEEERRRRNRTAETSNLLAGYTGGGRLLGG